MAEQVRNLLIGVFLIGAIILAVWLVLFLHPSVGNKGRTLYVEFTNVEKIGEGSRVTFAGKPVGEVVSVEPIRDGRLQRADRYGHLYAYTVTLAIDSSVEVYDTDEISIVTSGLFGERRINIDPMEPPPGVKPQPIGDRVIYAKSSDQMQDLLSELVGAADQMKETFALLGNFIEENGDVLGDAFLSLKEAFDAIQVSFDEINKTELVLNIKDALLGFTDLMDNLNKNIEQLEEEGFFTHLTNTFDNLSTTSEKAGDLADHLSLLTGNLNEGKGTVGKLFTDEALYQHTLALLCRGEELINDVNRYGFLFNTNNKWKRKEERRACMLRTRRPPPLACEVERLRTSLQALICSLQQEEKAHGPSAESQKALESLRKALEGLNRYSSASMGSCCTPHRQQARKGK